VTAERWRQIQDLCEAALEREGAERQAWLHEACASDAALLSEVGSLLERTGRVENFLESPLLTLTATSLAASGETARIGERISHYEIVSLIGTGGMGEVYLARDTRLRRDVAIKLLPSRFSRDRDRLAQFEREAHVLASLNHPHIAAIYGLEDANGTRALAMELIEGPTLAERLREGAIPLREALRIARQAVEALEAAHERGVVHCDFKPANVALSIDGTVKVLDFGLAEVASRDANAQTGGSPAAAIVGTAAYMSPEQASGRAVDKRTDIWAFGAVLYEMLTGQRAFQGETQQQILLAVAQAEPDWSQLPATTSSSVRRLLQRCLAKHPKERLRDIGDARWELEETSEAEEGSRAGAYAPTWLAVAVIAAALLGMRWIGSNSRAAEPPDLTFSIVPPPGTSLIGEGRGTSAPEISPDGGSVLFSTSNGGKYVRRLDALEPMRLPGAFGAWPAFWLPNGTSVGWREIPGGRLIRLQLPGGAPEVFGRVTVPERGIALTDSGDVLFASTPTPGYSGALMQLEPERGEARRIQIIGLDGTGDFYRPEFLPGSKNFLFLFVPAGGGEPEVHLAALGHGIAENPVVLLKNETAASFTPAGGGRLLFVRNDNLYAQKLNLRSRKVEGDAVLIAKGIVSQPGNSVYRAEFSVARTGAVAWRPGKAALSQITIFDRKGAVVGTAGQPSSINSIVLSPDETQLLAAEGSRAWVMEVNQPGRVTLPTGIHWFDWSVDGERLLGMRGTTEVVEARADGRPAVSTKGTLAGPVVGGSYDMAPNGRDLLTMNVGASDLLSASIEGSLVARTPHVLVKANGQVLHPRIAPDGRWIVYVARENVQASGIFVQPFPGPGRRRQIASDGAFPEWRGDGREIVYIGDGGVWSIAVDAMGNDLRFGTPQRLFSASLRGPGGPGVPARRLAVSRDGSRFFFPLRVEQPEANVIHVRTGAWVKQAGAH
jgi:eukaryotic-like serine/threonine-protein kinase